jgi:cytochrome P450
VKRSPCSRSGPQRENASVAKTPGDEEVFGNPYDFDVTRQNNDHVTFGKGSPHLCLGNLLARTEIRIMFEELIPRLSTIRLAGDVPRVRSNFVNGIKKLPVEVTLA